MLDSMIPDANGCHAWRLQIIINTQIRYLVLGLRYV